MADPDRPLAHQEKWNHYVCPDCGGITVSQEFDDGVTPFLLRCRAKDERHPVTGVHVQGCNGMAESSIYQNSQDPSQTPHVIFYRPSSAIEAIEAISKEPRRYRADMLEHYKMGGSLLKEAR